MTLERAGDGKSGLVVKSVKQGDDLYAAAKSARIRINCGFRTLVAAATPRRGYAKRNVGDLELNRAESMLVGLYHLAPGERHSLRHHPTEAEYHFAKVRGCSRSATKSVEQVRAW